MRSQKKYPLVPGVPEEGVECFILTVRERFVILTDQTDKKLPYTIVNLIQPCG